MDNATVIERLRAALPEAIQKTAEFRGALSIYVKPEAIVGVARFLRDDPELSYNFLDNLCGVDSHLMKTRSMRISPLLRSKNCKL